MILCTFVRVASSINSPRGTAGGSSPAATLHNHEPAVHGLAQDKVAHPEIANQETIAQTLLFGSNIDAEAVEQSEQLATSAHCV